MALLIQPNGIDHTINCNAMAPAGKNSRPPSTPIIGRASSVVTTASGTAMLTSSLIAKW